MQTVALTIIHNARKYSRVVARFSEIPPAGVVKKKWFWHEKSRLHPCRHSNQFVQLKIAEIGQLYPISFR
jgi:hypothetical protein